MLEKNNMILAEAEINNCQICKLVETKWHFLQPRFARPFSHMDEHLTTDRTSLYHFHNVLYTPLVSSYDTTV